MAIAGLLMQRFLRHTFMTSFSRELLSKAVTDVTHLVYGDAYHHPAHEHMTLMSVFNGRCQDFDDVECRTQITVFR
jgi:hypothetical protein